MCIILRMTKAVLYIGGASFPLLSILTTIKIFFLLLRIFYLPNSKSIQEKHSKSAVWYTRTVTFIFFKGSWFIREFWVTRYKMTLHSGCTGLVAAPQTRRACPCLGRLHSFFLLSRTLCPEISTCLAPSFALVSAQMSSLSEIPPLIIQSKIASLSSSIISCSLIFCYSCLLSVSPTQM